MPPFFLAKHTQPSAPAVSHHSPKSPVYMGTITKPHGIRGEVTLFCPAENVEALDGEVFLAPPGSSDKDENPCGLKPALVVRRRQHHGAVLVTLKGIADRTAADSLRRYRIFVDRDKLPEPDDDDYYIADLLGLPVYLSGPEGKTEPLGTLEAVDAPAGQELWSIHTPDGIEILMPAVPEFVEMIDLEAGLIIIAPPPGLLDIYTGPASAPEPEDE